MPGPRIAIAGPEELDTVLGILDETAAWLVSKGIRQWESPTPPDVQTLFADWIARGQVRLVWLNGEPVAAFRIELEAIPLWRDDANAGYVYTLAIRPAWIGRGLGEWIIRAIAAELEQAGHEYIRLDCISSNAFLRSWYERLGFVYRGTGEFHGYSLARYEAACATIKREPL